MDTFKCVTVFKKDGMGDVVSEMNTSPAFVQGTYCFSDPSEYYTSQFYVSQDLNYAEFHVIFNNVNSYKDWHSIFGELIEELVAKSIEDFKPLNITIERYFDDVEISGAENAIPYAMFRSKFFSLGHAIR